MTFRANLRASYVRTNGRIVSVVQNFGQYGFGTAQLDAFSTSAGCPPDASAVRIAEALIDLLDTVPDDILARFTGRAQRWLSVDRALLPGDVVAMDHPVQLTVVPDRKDPENDEDEDGYPKRWTPAALWLDDSRWRPGTHSDHGLAASPTRDPQQIARDDLLFDEIESLFGGEA
jgi:hypothetical protein